MPMCEGVVYLTQYFKSGTRIAIVSMAQLVDMFIRYVYFYSRKDASSNLTRNHWNLFVNFSQNNNYTLKH